MNLIINLLLLIISSSLCSGVELDLQKPKLIQDEKTFLDFETGEVLWDWKPVNNNTGVYANPKGSFSLTCLAPYPIEWRIDGVLHPPSSVLIQPFKREIDTEYDPPRLIFKAFLVVHFFGDKDIASADIFCQSVKNPDILYEKLSVFATGANGSTPFLLNATVLNLEDTLILPCAVTNPLALVRGFAEGGRLPVNQRLYDPVHGFKLEAANPGVYICIANDFQITINLRFSNQSENVILPKTTSLKAFTNESIRLECSSKIRDVQLSSNSQFEVIHNNATSAIVNLYFENKTSGNATCVIGNLKHVWNYEFIEPPRIHMDNFEGEADCLTDYEGRSIATIRCSNPSHCNFMRRCFQNSESCNLDRKHYFEDLRQARCQIKTESSPGQDCASIPYPHLNGLAQCRLEGISKDFEFFVSLHFRRYSNWIEAPEHELIRFQEVNETLYTNDTVTFFCEATSYLFADSINFMVEYKNGSKKFVDQSLIQNPLSEDPRKTDEFNVLGILSINLTLDVAAVHCLAPWWNSSEFLSVERKFETKHLLEPKITFKDTNITLTLGVEGQRLSCNATGEPKPDVQWFSGKRELDPYVFKQSTAASGESLLELPKVEEKHQGYYTCKATNFVGNTFKTFYVSVKAVSTNAVVYGSVFGVLTVLLVVVLLVLFYVLRRFQMARELFRKLSEQEVEEFLNGKEELVNCFHDSVEGFYYLPYDKSYEVSMKDLQYDTKDMLGSGQFAVVVKGILTGNAVAIKIPKTTADVVFFKSLLSEIKIMIHIGTHPHIVSLMGACTEEIMERKVHIIVEFCELGSMESYLRKNKSRFQDLQDQSQKDSKMYQNFTPEFTNIDLLLWSAQIADGMDFLAKKSIIHADLATRNILLTSNKDIKISDFGLSKKLYESNNYVKRSKVPLPWRWMALETLTTLTFSTETDVWSYGVTLWEIFTLGDIPFPNENWDKDFLKRLSAGMRMGRPKYCTLEIYNQFIACWDEEPSLRPTFTELKRFFEATLRDFQRK